MSYLYFPLATLTETQLQHLSEVLWSWSLCESCRNEKKCATESCSWRRSKRLAPFFDHYRNLTASYEPDSSALKSAALITHESLFDIIQRLKSNPDRTREQFTTNTFKDRACQNTPSMEDQLHAVNLAVRVLTMIHCSAQYQRVGLIEHGAFQNPWLSDVTFNQFILDEFPLTDHPSLNGGALDSVPDIKEMLTAGKLKKRLGLKFLPTNDLRQHLKLDREKNSLYIHHHTAFLKENLRLTKEISPDTSINDTLKL